MKNNKRKAAHFESDIEPGPVQKSTSTWYFGIALQNEYEP